MLEKLGILRNHSFPEKLKAFIPTCFQKNLSQSLQPDTSIASIKVSKSGSVHLSFLSASAVPVGVIYGIARIMTKSINSGSGLTGAQPRSSNNNNNPRGTTLCAYMQKLSEKLPNKSERVRFHCVCVINFLPYRHTNTNVFLSGCNALCAESVDTWVADNVGIMYYHYQNRL